MLGPRAVEAGGTAGATALRVSVDASRLGRLLPDLITVNAGARTAVLTAQRIVRRPRYVINTGANGALPGFATNA